MIQPPTRSSLSMLSRACQSVAAALALGIGTGHAAIPDPIIDLDASALPTGTDLASWANTGTLGGTFDKFAGGTGPNVTTVLGRKAVQFVQPGQGGDDRRTLASTTPAPESLSADNPWTISTLIYRSATQPGGENSFFQWAGGAYADLQSAIFRYTSNAAYMHWGADSGFNTVPSADAWHHVTITYDGTTEVIYVDGVVDKTDTRTLAINAGGLMIVGGRTWHDVRGEDQYWRFNGAIASIKVYEAALSAAEVAALTAVVTHDITVSYGENGTISPGPGTVAVDEGTSPQFTIDPDLGYRIAEVLVDNVSNPGAVSAGSYTFSNVTADHTISATFTAVPSQLVSGKVTDGTDPVVGATVYFKLSAPANVFPLFTATTNASGDYSTSLPPSASWHVVAGKEGYDFSVDSTFTVTGAAVPLPDIELNANPNWNVLFSLNTDDFSAIADGERIFSWEGFPAYNTFNNGDPELGPTVEVIDGVKWEKNVRRVYDDSTPPTIHARQDGFQLGTLPAPIATAGVSIVAVVKPEYKVLGGEPRGEIVDICYGTLYLATNRNNGEVIVCTKGYVQYNTGYFIPNGQKTVLSLVVQPAGEVVLYANGTEQWSHASGSDYTTLGKFGGFDKLTVGRNGYDDWSVFNGNIGDVYVYKTALDNADRETLESALMTKFGIVLRTITASAGTGGKITPVGNVNVVEGSSQNFVIAPDYGFAVADVLVDGNSEGPVTSYLFENVTAPHSIAVSFEEAILSYSNWTYYHGFLTNEDAERMANPDGDAFPNYAEYALDEDPLSAAPSGKTRSRVEDVNGEQALVITLPVLTGASFTGATSQSASIGGLTYIIEGSNDLSDFDQVVEEVVPASSAGMPDLTFVGPNGWTYRTFRLSGAVPARGAKGFLRVRVSDDQPM